MDRPADEHAMERRSGRLIGGLVLMTLGGIFLLGRLDVLPEHDLRQLWPLILIAIGLGKMLGPWSRDRGAGVTVLLVGVWAFANIHHWFGLTWHNSWPLVLILIGLKLLVVELLPQLGERDAG